MTKSVLVRTASSNYEVIIDKFLLKNYNFQWLAENKQILIVKDSQVPEKFLKSLKENLERLNPLKLISIEIETNEETKSIEGIQPIYEILNRNKFNRDCVIISLGGGITTDMTGFVASSYLRGVSLIQIPSTLLAQVDAAIGGKTGINFQGVKNNIGAFYQPSLVLIDVNLLSSLGKNEISEGLAEIIKHSLIADKSLFFELEQKINNGAIENDTDLIKIIYESSLIKSSIVSNDEKELGDRALLNFGHTYGHAFESSMSLKGFSHGQAVGLGMICASKLSMLLGNIEAEEFERIKNVIQAAGLPNKLPDDFNYSEFKEAMSRDKKILSNKLRFITLNSIGRAQISENIDENTLLESLKI